MRLAILVVAAALLFAAVVLIGLRVLPEPHSETDYLVVGCIATFVSLGGVFAALIATRPKMPDARVEPVEDQDEKEL